MKNINANLENKTQKFFLQSAKVGAITQEMYWKFNLSPPTPPKLQLQSQSSSSSSLSPIELLPNIVVCSERPFWPRNSTTADGIPSASQKVSNIVANVVSTFLQKRLAVNPPVYDEKMLYEFAHDIQSVTSNHDCDCNSNRDNTALMYEYILLGVETFLHHVTLNYQWQYAIVVDQVMTRKLVKQYLDKTTLTSNKLKLTPHKFLDMLIDIGDIIIKYTSKPLMLLSPTSLTSLIKNQSQIQNQNQKQNRIAKRPSPLPLVPLFTTHHK